MSAPPITLILDVSALTATDVRDWIGFSRAGACFIPQTVFEEMRFLYDRSPDSDLERVSREFNRFYTSSGWQITEVSGHHPLLKASASHALTRRVRVALAVARCAYGMAQKYPHSLVVLVASDRSIIQRIEDIQTANLIAISNTGLLQWSRTGQRPAQVQQTLQEMRSANLMQAAVVSGAPKKARSLPDRYPAAAASRRTSTRESRSTSYVSPPARRRPLPRPTGSSIKRQGAQLVALLTAMGALLFAGVIVWMLFYTTTFDRFFPSNPATPELPN